MFIHLRVHSAYSLSEGALFLKKLPTLCLENDMPAVAVTDTHNLFGAMEFSLAASERGIQPIIGCQLKLKMFDDTDPQPFVALAQNETGYLNLCKLMSKSYLREEDPRDPFTLWQELAAHNEGLLAFTGGQYGPLAPLMRVRDPRALGSLHMMKEVFSHRLHMELLRHPAPDRLEPVFLQWALSEGIPLVATNDVYFDRPDMFEAHDALLCIAESRYISEDDRRRVTPHHFFKSSAQMQQLFHDLPEAYENTVWIAKRCAFRPTPRQPILPHYPTTTSEEHELKTQASRGLQERLKTIPKDQHHTYLERLEFELSVITKMGFSGYFLIVADFIQWAKSQNIPVGPGRGSGAGSVVAWALTITDIDPIRFNLLFERFLNPERVSMPDFDVDFCQDRRDEVIRYVCGRYGHDRVAHIITFGKLQARAALRDVGRVLQMPYSQVDRICKLIPNNPAAPVTLSQALELEPALKQEYTDDESVKKLMDTAQKIEGLYRHASTHAAGVVIGDRPLQNLVPLYKDPNSPLPATQFSMKYAEIAGLVKFDFLGLKTLTVIEAAAQLIRTSHDPNFHIQNIALDDKKTFELLTQVRTVGIFQLESGGMRDVLKKLRPDRFEDLIALVALYRPGPMDDIPRYLACKHGTEAISYAHPALKPILATTYGVMVYQEQVMQIAQILGGYSLGDADLLRRAMGKKIISEMEAQRERFVRGAIEKGVQDAIAVQIFEQMAKFAGYGFNKSHSAPYALLAYQTAYLKANYPKEFFAATMTHDMHTVDKLIVYKQDMERMGIPLFGPDINKSFSYFSVEGEGVRYGLSAIKNVGVQSVDLMTDNRKRQGPFKSLDTLVQRVDGKALNKRQMENLIAAGAFDSICSHRRFLWESLEGALSGKHQSKQNTLFAAVEQKPKGPNWPLLEKLSKEFDALGFYMSAHPLDMYKSILETLNVTRSSELHDLTSSQIELAGILLSKQERTSKQSGQKFAILTFSDLDGIFEVTLFSDTYQSAKDLLVPGTALHMSVWLKRDGDMLRLSGQSLSPLQKNQNFTLNIPKDSDLISVLERLKTLPEGDTTLTLKFCLKYRAVQAKIQGRFDFQACQGIV